MGLEMFIRLVLDVLTGCRISICGDTVLKSIYAASYCRNTVFLEFKCRTEGEWV